MIPILSPTGSNCFGYAIHLLSNALQLVLFIEDSLASLTNCVSFKISTLSFSIYRLYDFEAWIREYFPTWDVVLG